MLYISLALFCLLIFGCIYYYNQLIIRKNRMNEAWSGIDVYLKKRYELIPNLIETVKGYAGYEQKILQNLTTLRAEASQAVQSQEKMDTEHNLSQQISRFMVIAENYPDLKQMPISCSFKRNWKPWKPKLNFPEDTTMVQSEKIIFWFNLFPEI